MRRYPRTVLALAVGLGFWWMSGCNLGALLPTEAVNFPLQGSLGTFDVQSGVPVTNKGTLNFDPKGITLGRGSLQLTPDAISVVPADSGGGKVGQALQETSELEITVWADSPEAIDTVCETGDQYGPYTITLDENLEPVSISPNTLTLTEKTIGLLNDGQLSVCVEVVSPVTGQVVVDSLRFNLGL